MDVSLQQWLPLIFVQYLFYSYVVQCHVSLPDCEFPDFGALPVPTTPSFPDYPLDPWTPRQVLPPWWVPNSPMIPWMPRQLVPPPSTPAHFRTPVLPGIPSQLLPPPSASSRTVATLRHQTPPSFVPGQANSPMISKQLSPPPAYSQPTAPSLPQIARQLTPPPSIPEQSNTHSLPKTTRQLYPPQMPRAQSNTPSIPQSPAQIVSSPFSPGESSTQQQSGLSSSFRQLQFGQQPFLFQGKSSSSSSRAKAVGKAVGVTLAITIIAAGVLIFFILRGCKRRRREALNSGVVIGTPPSTGTGGGKKNLKGLIVDEKGQDMVYWRKDDEARKSISTEPYDLYKERVRKDKDNLPLPSAPISEVNQQLESQSPGVRFKLGDKELPAGPLALVSTEAHLPPLWPSVRKGLGKPSAGKENIKPLQRDQVRFNEDHAAKHHGGSPSLSYDGDLMEAMFGSMAVKKRTSRSAEEKSPATPSSSNMISTQIFLLDPMRSQNISTILRSIKVTRQELLDALIQGKGLDADILGKLSRITPTKREEALILAYHGHPPCLSHAESFLYHIMKSVPLAFPRLNAMLFRSNYQTELQYLDEHVRTLERGCCELRESVLLYKLIESALMVGNEMNAGAIRGAAHSFNLNSIWKLFDIQSLDGKNTIIQSVVEELAISEGRQCVMDRENRLNLSTRNMDSTRSLSKQNSRKFMILGLPLVSGLSAGFPNAKNAASMDYYTYFLTASSTLAAGLNDIQATVRQCNSRHGDGGFVTEMKAFLDKATIELGEKTEEQMRVFQLVKRTTEYYQSGAPTNEHASPFQLFTMVKEFLDMVDQACKHLSENLHRRKMNEANTEPVFVNVPPV